MSQPLPRTLGQKKGWPPAFVDQRRIPDLSRLYLDFVYNFDAVAPFFSGGGRERALAAATRQDYPAARRAVVAEVLKRQNEEFGSGAATHEVLRRFRQADTVAVVTGQQVGLFGGPLLTMLKALTAIRLASELNARGAKAVPVFWLATQDHDLAEVNHAWGLSPESQPVRVQTATKGAGAEAPVGTIRLGDEITAALEEFARLTGRSPEQMATLAECYRPGATFAQAFGRLMARWLEPWGLILMDPLDQQFAGLVHPIYERVLERQAELQRALQERDGALVRAGYHAQVRQTPGATMLFLMLDGARHPLRRMQGRCLLGNLEVSANEIERLMQRPENISPSALVRPLIQDELLPTVAQVAGPAELAYLAQSDALAPVLGLRRPAVLPRASATLVDARAARLLEHYELTIEDLWREPAAELLARRTFPEDLSARIAHMRTTLQSDLDVIGERLLALDRTLCDPLQTAASKIHHQLEQMETRIARAMARRHEEVQRHATHLAGLLVPERKLQERVLSGAEWDLRTEGGVFATLHDQISPNVSDHLILRV
jgi:bacillithiol biosynthesis cysteine-adding enzyme BshC